MPLEFYRAELDNYKTCQRRENVIDIFLLTIQHWRSTVTGKFPIPLIQENYTKMIRPRMSTRGVRKL